MALEGCECWPSLQLFSQSWLWALLPELPQPHSQLANREACHLGRIMYIFRDGVISSAGSFGMLGTCHVIIPAFSFSCVFLLRYLPFLKSWFRGGGLWFYDELKKKDGT